MSDLKVVKDKKDDIVGAPMVPKAKKPTKAELKKQAKERAEMERKAMEGQIKNMHNVVQKSKCKTCKHCSTRDVKIDRFEVKSSKGDELFCPMNFCTVAGLSLVDVQECSIYEEVKNG